MEFVLESIISLALNVAIVGKIIYLYIHEINMGLVWLDVRISISPRCSLIMIISLDLFLIFLSHFHWYDDIINSRKTIFFSTIFYQWSSPNAIIDLDKFNYYYFYYTYLFNKTFYHTHNQLYKTVCLLFSKLELCVYVRACVYI